MAATISHSAKLERAERRMQRLWYGLAMAERHGQPDERLERLCRLYLRTLEDYVQLSRCLEQPLAS